ncbi:MAG: orotidine-5'-phosphate decarboxylase [Leptospirales bacterium]
MNQTILMMNTPKSNTDFLIVALDYDKKQDALELVSRLENVNYYKVGMQLFYSAGFEIIEDLKKLDKKVFLDLKINDIPNTISKAVKSLSRLNVDLLTVFTSSDGVKAAAEAAQESAVKILNVTVLTSQAKEPSGKNISDQVLERAELTLKNGGHGIICSGAETSIVREKLGNDLIIVNPGIRPVGVDAGDQKRIVTPAEAKNSGASHIVVGRPITQAIDPVRSVSEILSSL